MKTAKEQQIGAKSAISSSRPRSESRASAPWRLPGFGLLNLPATAAFRDFHHVLKRNAMDRLEAMTILLAAVDTGSLSAASRHLRIPLATVSRRVAELEEHLHVRLLHRSHRKVVLTDAGRSYVDSCRRIMEEIAEVERTASGEYRTPQGELIITAPAVLGRSHVLPIVAEFQRAFPDIRMRLQLMDRYVNLVEEHVDLAVRIGELE